VTRGKEGGGLRWEGKTWRQSYSENESPEILLRHKNGLSSVNSLMSSIEKNTYQSSDQSIITLSQLDMHASTVKPKAAKLEMKRSLSEEYLRPLYQLPENPTNAEIRHYVNGSKLRKICKVIDEDQTKSLNQYVIVSLMALRSLGMDSLNVFRKKLEQLVVSQI
jgi:hypothetical protein